MKNRILSLLLVLLMVVSLIPGSVFAAEDCDCDLTEGVHAATCPNYVCPDCGTAGWHETCPETGDDTGSDEQPGASDETETPAEGEGETSAEGEGETPAEGEGETEEPGGEDPTETAACEVCGADPCTCEQAEASCPYCDYTLAEDGTVIHSEICYAEYAYDGTADVGKYVQLVPEVAENGVSVSADPLTDDGIWYYYYEFGDNTVMKITGWYWDPDTSGLWYRVELYKGAFPESTEEYQWPVPAWILQDYTDYTYDYDAALEFVSITCDICGKEGCTAEHVVCELCGNYDCTVQHTYCGGCGALDCTTEHIACPICHILDCGLEHEQPEQEEYTPLTAPVIPEDPQLPEEYDVAITDASGTSVTESGIRLESGEQASLSAWSALGEDVSYQWQIFIDEGDGYWVDITGQTGKGLLFSRAMVMSALDDSGCARLRCVTDNGSETAVSAEVSVDAGTEISGESAELSVSMLATRALALASGGDVDAQADDPGTGTSYVTVTIHYWTGDSFGKDVKTPVFEPYVANILKGSAFNTPVISPTYLGYAAFYDENGDGTLTDDEDATSFNPGLAAVYEDTVFNLYYQPIEVPIAIRYFFQNINDDDYTENTAYYYSGMEKTGTIVSDAFLDQCLEAKAGAGILKGFSKMHHNPEAVAADGSTVFECYYDRNYFMIALALDGGYGVEPIYARYETPVLVNNPVKPGHTFQYWDQMPDTNSDGVFEAGDGAADSLPTTLPAENRKYAAVWSTSSTTYTVVYWLGSADGTDNTYLGSSTTPGITGEIATSNLYDCGLTEHSHTDACIGCGLEEHDHTAAGCARSDTLICGKEEHIHGGVDCDCTLEEHTHGDGCCTIDEHTHSLSCYSSDDSLTAGQPSNNNARTVYNALQSLDSNYIANGRIYRGRAGNNYRYFLYLNEEWYYLGTDTGDVNVPAGGWTTAGNVNGINITYKVANVNTGACSEAEHTHGDGKCTYCSMGMVEHTHGLGSCACDKEAHTHTDACYDYACGLTEHSHDDSCIACGMTEHNHVDSCEADLPFDTSKMTYVEEDTNVVIKGDASTIVNVYYKYKDYTLRFYYARSKDGVYQVPGGSTYPFGKYGSNNEDTTVAQLLANVGDWGAVTGLNGTQSDLNAKGQGRVKTVDNVNGAYTLGSYTPDGSDYTYYYLEFTAPYLSNLKDLWPVDIFNSVTSAVHTHAINTGSYTGDNKVNVTCDGKAYFSAWNGEFKVKYTQEHANQTIKGLYLYLDDNLLFDTTQFDDGTPVSYLCFWENGSNVGWSFPELYEYKLWVKPTSALSADDVLYGDDKTADHYDANYSRYNGYVLFDDFDVYDDSSPSQQTATYIKGYGSPEQVTIALDSDSSDGTMEHYIINYFYSCDDYTLTVQNYGSTVVGGEDSIAYGTPLKDIMTAVNGFDPDNGYAPDYPSGSLEAGGYYFEGWYTTEEFTDGTKVNIDTATMPDDDLFLYARWLPRTHTVQFFYNLTDLQDYNSGKTVELYEGENGGPRYVLHGKTVSESDTEHPLTHPDHDHDDTTDDEHMSFVRWFYLENGKKVAFSPDDTLIKKDLNVYAEWRDKRIQSFRISYELDDGTKIADDEFGYAYMSSTRTFTAKAGDPDNELYEGYNTGYFPIAASHSMVMQYENDLENPVKNLYTFQYVAVNDVNYRIRYVNALTGALLEETDPISSGGKNVVTVRYKPLDGYTPDAFYKRLVLSVKLDGGSYVGDDDANVITFYYTPSTTSARYVIHYMIEDLTGGTYSENHAVEGIGAVDALATITPTEIPGFALIADEAEYYVDGVKQGSGPAYSDGAYSFMVKMEGSELYLYFKRLEYDYAVYYYLYNTTTLVDATNHPSVAKYALYGATVTETAPDIADYTCVSAQKTVTITIREESAPHGELAEPIKNVTQNKIIFYYMPKQYIVDYVPVPAAGGKIFPSTRETITGTGEVTGVTWTANQYYEFEGWFMDAACTQGIDGYATLITVDGVTTMVPDKSKLVADDGSGNTANTFYAKFKLLAADFTITKENARPGQVFVYRVEGNGLSIDVTVVAGNGGTGSTTIAKLPFGEYTVTQQNSWSWRYISPNAPSQNVLQRAVHSSADGVQFVDVESVSRWLSGISDFIKRIFGGS